MRSGFIRRIQELQPPNNYHFHVSLLTSPKRYHKKVGCVVSQKYVFFLIKFINLVCFLSTIMLFANKYYHVRVVIFYFFFNEHDEYCVELMIIHWLSNSVDNLINYYLVILYFVGKFKKYVILCKLYTCRHTF